jgi:hypothetical protein
MQKWIVDLSQPSAPETPSWPTSPPSQPDAAASAARLLSSLDRRRRKGKFVADQRQRAMAPPGSRRWAYVRVMAGTILGGVLGLYVMHRVETSYKVRLTPQPLCFLLRLALSHRGDSSHAPAHLAACSSCRRGWRSDCGGTRRICSPRPRRRSSSRTRRSGMTRPSYCRTRGSLFRVFSLSRAFGYWLLSTCFSISTIVRLNLGTTALYLTLFEFQMVRL